MKEIRPALFMLLLFTIVCGGFYPAVITGLARLLFPSQANGSLLVNSKGKVVGSALIGQPFSDPKYLWPRPSATADFAYNPMASGGSNISPASSAYVKTIDERLRRLHAGDIHKPIASDLVQSSGSGLDPHVSPQAAAAQVTRIAQARGWSEKKVIKIILANREGRQFGFLGAPRVNVLAVNMALDDATP